MAYDKNILQVLYKKLLTLYPRAFRERLGESMQQTFNDLSNEQKRQPARVFFMLSIFAETAIGIVREHLFIIMQGDFMKTLLTNPRSAALISFILCLPLGVPFVVFMSDIELLTRPLNNLFTVSGHGGDINMLGRIVIFGGLLLLPVAFVFNLQPMLVREGPERRRTLHRINLIVGAAILLLITFTWGALLLEEIYCLRGIRCD